MPIIDFHLVKKTPNLNELRAYLYQLINSYFGLSNTICESLVQRKGDSSEETIRTLSFEEIKAVLEDYFPSFILYFQSHVNSDVVENQNYCEYPEYFTNIKQVVFDCGGLITMESYNNQIFTLFNAKGEQLSDKCHDLDIGENGLILLRSSSSPIWELLQVHNDELIETNHPSPHIAYTDFPDLMYRDAIEESLNIELSMEDLYTDLSHISIDEAHALLKNREGHFRNLIPFYVDNEELATLAMEDNILAFTFLSPALRNNRNFVLSQLKKGGEFLMLYRYLSEDLKHDLEIVKLCIEDTAGIVYKIAPIDDKEIIRRAVKASPYYFEYASEYLRSDREFVLELAKEEWRILDNSTPSVYTDVEFIQTVIKEYNEIHEEKVEFIDVVSFLIRNEGGHSLIDALLPISDEGLFIKILQVAKPSQFDSMITGLAESSLNSSDFWLKAVKNNKEFVSKIPNNLMEDFSFALKLIECNGEFLHFLNSEFHSNAVLFLSAIRQIKNRRGSVNPEGLYTLLSTELKKDRIFLSEACTLDDRILNHATLELKGDINFQTELLTKTRGWSYIYASEELQVQLDFIRATLNTNPHVYRNMSQHVLEMNEVRRILIENNIDPNKVISDDDLPF